jgi:hypothetical protein
MHWYITRLCWNTNGWQRPSGTAEETDSFCAQNGFGLEEWLFSPLLHGAWCYGFVQGVSRHVRAPDERELCLLFYALRPPGPSAERLFVAQMRCEMLEPAEAAAAFHHFNTNGTIAQMRNEVPAGGNAGFFDNVMSDGSSIFNIRYRPHEAVVYPQFVRVPSGHFVADPDYKRYHLYQTSPDWH